MNKKLTITIFGIILLIGMVIAPAIITQIEDKTLDISLEDKTTLDDLNVSNFTYYDKLDFDKAIRYVSANGYNLNFEVEVRTFTDECVSWNVSFVDAENILQTSIESSPNFNNSFIGRSECVSSPRLNKTSSQINSKLDDLYNKRLGEIAQTHRDREARIITEPIREGNIGVSGR